jgi:hypothetical protein
MIHVYIEMSLENDLLLWRLSIVIIHHRLKYKVAVVRRLLSNPVVSADGLPDGADQAENRKGEKSSAAGTGRACVAMVINLRVLLNLHIPSVNVPPLISTMQVSMCMGSFLNKCANSIQYN